MDPSEDKLWASKYVLDPLTAPEPSQETGPGTHHNTTYSRPHLYSSLSHDSASPRQTSGSNRSSQPPPPAYSSIHRERFPNHDRSAQRRSTGQASSVTASTTGQAYLNRYSADQASTAIPTSPTGRSSRFSDAESYQSASQRQSTGQASLLIPASTGQPYTNRHSTDRASTAISTSPTDRSSRFFESDSYQSPLQRQSVDQASTAIPTKGRPRNASLLSRFEGDQSHRPLEIIKRDTKLANRAPHLRKQHHVGPDTIDNLDTVGGGYHHEGPFDATLLARNTVAESSPVAAVHDTNMKALKATPREMIQDSIRAHRPLDGVALIPPGVLDRNGQRYDYDEKNLITEGDYKRWPGVKYLDDDLKGKGEPSYSLDRALKDKKGSSHRRIISEGANGIPLTTQRPRPSSAGADSRSVSESLGHERYADWEGSLRQSDRRNAGGLKRHISSLRRR